MREAVDAHAELAALSTLAALLRQVLSNRLSSSNAPLLSASILSRGQNRGEVHATPDEPAADAPPRAAANRPVRRGPQATGGMPAWSGLPTQTQAALIELMTRLIFDHAGKSRLGSTTEADHDL